MCLLPCSNLIMSTFHSVHVYACVYVCVSTCACVYVCMRASVWVQMCVSVCVYVCVCVQMCVCVRACVQEEPEQGCIMLCHRGPSRLFPGSPCEPTSGPRSPADRGASHEVWPGLKSYTWKQFSSILSSVASIIKGKCPGPRCPAEQRNKLARKLYLNAALSPFMAL